MLPERNVIARPALISAAGSLKCRKAKSAVVTKIGFVELCSPCVGARPEAFLIGTASGPRSCLACDPPAAVTEGGHLKGRFWHEAAVRSACGFFRK